MDWRTIEALICNLIREWEERPWGDPSGRESRNLMWQDLHPDTDDPQYAEKLRALYPGLDQPETWLDLGYQALYPAIFIPQSEQFLRRLREQVWKEWSADIDYSTEMVEGYIEKIRAKYPNLRKNDE